MLGGTVVSTCEGLLKRLATDSPKLAHREGKSHQEQDLGDMRRARFKRNQACEKENGLDGGHQDQEECRYEERLQL